MTAIPPSMAAIFGADDLPERFPPNLGGAMLIALTYLRLGGFFSDLDAIFDAFAPIAVDERGFIPSIEEPKRGAE